MKPRFSRIVRHGSLLHRITGLFVALLLSCVVASGQDTPLPSNTPPPGDTPAEEEVPKIPNDQLDSLVAPIALFPDPLLAQTLAASTYPLEIIQLQQWMEKNKNLKGKALADAVAKQKWDPSIQSLAAFPDVTQRLAGNVQWTTDLGNAFLSQQADVMDAVQRMRTKANSKGSLKTTSQQKVTTKTVENNKEVIVIEQADPQVVYVPSYDPEVVYGPPAYPYYPYSYPGYYPGMGLAWGTGLILGAGIANDWWGDCDWNGGDININNNNNFNRNNISNRPAGDRNNRWQHRPEHRGNAPYSNRATQKKYGDTRRSQAANRPSQQPNRGPGGDRRPTDRPSTADRKGPDRSASNRQAADRSAANRKSADRSTANRPQNRSSNSIGNRQVSRSPSPRSNSAFSAPSRQMSRNSSFASQSRGFSSMGGSRGGMRGGGSRGGGRRR